MNEKKLVKRKRKMRAAKLVDADIHIPPLKLITKVSLILYSHTWKLPMLL